MGNSHQSKIRAVVNGLISPAASSEKEASENLIPLGGLLDDDISHRRSPAKILTGDIFLENRVQIAPATLMAGSSTRPILKIQDGCNNRCDYCVIPFFRGRSRSLLTDIVIEEVGNLVAAGAKEIVLSGINLGSYGRDLTPRAALSAVVRRILAETELQLLRFSSIEPQDITEDFVGLAACSERIAPHFHIPLQSGSNRVLKAMHRWYRSEHYAERVKLIRRLLPCAAIGADVIAGFPGETEEDFQSTLDFIGGLPFTYLHVFSFSVRPGTEAARLGDQVPAMAIRARARALRVLAQKKYEAFRISQETPYARFDAWPAAEKAGPKL